MPAPTTSYHLRISQSQSYPVNITFLSWHRKSVIVGNCILTTVFSLRNSCGEPWIYSSCDMLPSYSLVELTPHDLRPHLVYTEPVSAADPFTPWGPGNPGSPAGPCAPVSPLCPFSPGGPPIPGFPSSPFLPGSPSLPGKPGAPIKS